MEIVIGIIIGLAIGFFVGKLMEGKCAGEEKTARSEGSGAGG